MTDTVADMTLARLRRFLERKAVPRHLEGKTEAQADEVGALLQVLSNFVPGDAEQFELWWPQVETQLGVMIKNVWPTEREVSDACRLVAAKVVTFPTRAPEPVDDHRAKWVRQIQNIADQMNAGLPVGEPALYGMIAAEIEVRGLVTPEVIEGYRRACYAARQKAYGGESAQAWAQERNQYHELCKQSVTEARHRTTKP